MHAPVFEFWWLLCLTSFLLIFAAISNFAGGWLCWQLGSLLVLIVYHSVKAVPTLTPGNHEEDFADSWWFGSTVSAYSQQITGRSNSTSTTDMPALLHWFSTIVPLWSLKNKSWGQANYLLTLLMPTCEKPWCIVCCNHTVCASVTTSLVFIVLVLIGHASVFRYGAITVGYGVHYQFILLPQ